MAAAIVDLTGDRALEQGATYRLTYLWKTGTPAAAVNLTGYTARVMFKTSSLNDASQIIAITKANPGVVTTKTAHKLKTGQTVVLPGVGGMTELTARYTVTALTATTFSIGVNTTSYTTYTSGGTVAFVSLTNVISTDGQLILGTTLGDVQLYIKDTTTDKMSGGGTYDLELIGPTPAFDVTRLAQGIFEVNPNTTR